ncbi:shieldin complex subunit 2 isoform X1 [Falco rusticolus]|uniref:shieldin complex subunit 2 isoform X1 n=1 Tax=Falco rusticolus TaxID=120794 RepID=UPI000392F853|nr:shieldin complex subunit 2 isoform X1 [Falco rusticolus]XP_037255129.1 shieldin complex subunit 2 isoform X1 [Falco rusticolus]XP_037255130.1 shieldin complex subunit 2 isoform X1 [Falco rusticolus]XP_037255131.1 shieldin complex subunit 2 isoform X1 [Falco rusticolus]XP_037255132.1 shieldin complex subunit 2 isoform X1 [Falco rusticolus]XP_037255133.1 shieldin complex subunit 2 isoform X1 [Falco rusticolus]XP_037255135.1 shieldin complex subunit 2 isoform X1 [Falco rusticolus]XP_03725513
MTKRRQIHIFVGAPNIPSLVEMSEQSSSAPAAEKWRELRCWCDTHSLFPGKVKDADHLMFQTESSIVTAVPTSDDSSKQSEQGRLMVAKEILTSLVPAAVTCASTPKKTKSLIYSDCQISTDKCAHANVNQAANQHFAQRFAESTRQYKQSHGGCSNLTERKASHVEFNSSYISDLVASTKQISVHLRSVGEVVQSDCRSDCREHRSQYLDLFFPQNRESKPKGQSSDCLDFAVSTDTEFRSIITSSQMAVFAWGRNEMRKRTVKLLETEAGKKTEKRQYDQFQFDPDVGTCLNVAENEYKEEYTSSLELFSSEGDAENVCFEATKQEGAAQGNAEKSQERNVPAEQLENEIHIEPLSSGILCSQVDSSRKICSERARQYEDSFHIFPPAFERRLKPKRAKLNSSPAGPGMRVDQERMAEFKKLQKKLTPLKNCCCRNQKYNVLVTIVHPCHIREIQMKTRPKSSCTIPVATIVVIDQSEIERKVVLWRSAAFWSLTVFPGDVVLLTDLIMYENLWCGEIMLQSTFTSQLLNLGNCSALNPEEFCPVVDGDALHGLLSYVSSEFPHFRDIPRRQVQSLDSVQYMQLDQLQPNTLVHSVLKVINIAVLIESVYRYRGGNQKKIVLTVEQNRGQHYRMVLWGAGAAWCPQLQRKKEHLWDFKYLLVQRSSVSGDFELHTTPWSSYECLFDDDRRAIEFKEKFQKSKASLMQVTKLSTHLEEKCSGVIQVKARILELKFTISTGQCKQLTFCADTSLECVLASLPMITYSGCAQCGLELLTDKNMIYKQCIRCLPYNKVKTFYRPAVMTVEDGGYEIYVHVASELMEKIFLSIPADWLNRLVVPSSDITYSTIVADLCHLLLADTEASYLLEIRSHFVLDENSYPLQKDFHLLNLHPDLGSIDLCNN